MNWQGADDLTDKLVPIDSLAPFPGNPRRGDSQAVAASLKRFGQTRPVLVDGDTIIAGHHVVDAARLNGWTHVAVTANAFHDDEEARAYMLADNGLGRIGGFDDTLLLDHLQRARETSLIGTGYTDEHIRELRERLDRLRDQSVLERLHEDPIPPVPAQPESRRGEIYELGEHRLMCGDASDPDDIDRLLDGERPPLTFTSPPYGIGLTYGDYTDDLDNLRRLIAALSTLWRDRIADAAYAVVNFQDLALATGRELAGADEPCDYPMTLEYWQAFRAAGWLLRTRRIWAKPHARVAQPWTAATNLAALDWEHLWTWKKPGVPAVNERRSPSYLGVWSTQHEPSLEIGKGEHPAGFPVALPSWALTIYTNQADTVADPFAGTGTTLIAAEALGRRCLAMEIDPGFCDVTRRRYAALVEARDNLTWSLQKEADLTVG